MTLPEGWVETTIGEVVQPIETANPAGKPDHTFRYVDIGSIDNRLLAITEPKEILGRDAPSRARRRIRRGDILFSTVRPYLKNIAQVPAALDGEFTSTGVCVLRGQEGVESGFLFRRVASQDFIDAMTLASDGTMYPAIADKDVFAGAISLPPKAEQRRIVAKLDALTARLARARAELDRVPVLVEREHLALLRAGITGSLTAEWREASDVEPIAETLQHIPAPQQGRGGREATDKVIPGTAGIAVNDPGTPLPPGWAWVSLLRVAKQETGHTPSRSKPEYWDGGVPWIGIRDAGAHHGRVIETTMQTISEAGLANSSARLLPAETVCLSRTASVGYVTMMKGSMATSQDFATWTCTEALLPEYLLYALMAEGDDIQRFGMGSTHTTIYFPEIRAFHIALPPVEEQREIVSRLKTALTRADRMEAEGARARALIDRLEAAILAKAFRGELVPQDPNDEPASVLLDRIRAERAAAPKAKRGRRPKAG
ncbi:restriction endonuclease subunit S [uncultured Sphingopyxis sp.]|uniref:restriction endonuclease subunit S n=1 Tax=uncultured Sphingopyxis sp. TaxID=310581 RepID=UPI000A8D4375|nr:restriction endonuclease subunit S [uncultured Sphingopyxis sp.]